MGWLGFNLLECTLLWDLFDIAADIVMMLLDLILFVIDVTKLFAKIFKPIICLTRYFSEFPFPVYDGNFVNCDQMCFDVNRTAGCYSFSTALIWSIQNIPELVVNVIDMGVPLIYYGLHVMSTESGVSEGAWPNVRSLWEYLELVINSDGRVVWKKIYGLFINYVMTLPDITYCRLFSKYFSKCMLAFLCKAILGKISSLYFHIYLKQKFGPITVTFSKWIWFNFKTAINYPAICGTESCPCANCDWPYRYILGFNDPANIFYKCPCSTYSCTCDPDATFLEEVISDWHDINVP